MYIYCDVTIISVLHFWRNDRTRQYLVFDFFQINVQQYYSLLYISIVDEYIQALEGDHWIWSLYSLLRVLAEQVSLFEWGKCSNAICGKSVICTVNLSTRTEWGCKDLQNDVKIVTVHGWESSFLDLAHIQLLILLLCEAAAPAGAGGVLCHIRAISPFCRDGGGDGDAAGICFLT